MGYLSFYFKYECHAVEIIFFSCCYETLIYINTFLTCLDVCAEQLTLSRARKMWAPFVFTQYLVFKSLSSRFGLVPSFCTYGQE